ncbi:DNA repair protein RecN [Parabacteroides sp. Marseille-P3160]|uniref:DNA repair protein RecN n=1 Tax=Parabacteroides sp. Marseille-P3160 TaxID=1917887 RepID=UPI0009B9CC7A|nr:DNA repair protein RecN [Parabacteroides sp. Marseille-P3160]
MLKSLLIQNFILIDHLEISFSDGFSVITGETGAGKSIILGALGLVLGQRADQKSIQAGADKCVIEAEFDLSKYNLAPFFQDHELEYDADSCILRRELYSSGKSRGFINDSPAPLTLMRELGSHLIDIHSQHQNLLLADTHFQLNVVDIMAGTSGLFASYKKSYRSWQMLKGQLAGLEERARRSKEEEDYIRFQYEELRETNLTDGEQEALEQELETLTHAEEIKSGLYRITELLDGEEQGAIALIKESLQTMEALGKYYSPSNSFSERLRSAYLDLKDLAAETDVLKEDVEFSPERLNWINERLNTFYSLEQKHRVSSVEELIILRNRYEIQLKEIDSFDESIEEKRKEVQTAYQDLLGQAGNLSRLRRSASEPIRKQLVANLVQLGMPNMRFQVDIHPKSEPGPDGTDEVAFLFSANKNEPLNAVAQTASGGEISRLMLCVKAMIAGSTALPSIIFDEIDTGVSGDIAHRMGEIMQELGRNMQVITITHLPQIAAKGKEHFFVYKEDTADRTYTRLRKLTPGERVSEIAAMLSGSELTEASIANAKNLLENN